MKAFEYVDVPSIDAALAALPADEADVYGRKTVLKAGGLDLIDQMKERMIEPDRLLNLRSLEKDLRYIREDGGTLRIGPLATMSDVAKNPVVREKFPALATACGDAATPQIRNVATIGGNLLQRPRCWYFRNAEFHCIKKGGDVCFAKEGENQYHAIFGIGPSYIVHPSNAAPPLVACGAEFALKSPRGERVVAAGDFFTMPDEDAMVENSLASDEMLVEIRVPLARIKASAHVELREKASYDWALVAASAVRMDDGWKVVMGAVAPIPWRAEATEAELGDKAMTAELANKAGEAAAQGADPLRYNRYKVDLVKTTVRRALLAAAGMEATA